MKYIIAGLIGITLLLNPVAATAAGRTAVVPQFVHNATCHNSDYITVPQSKAYWARVNSSTSPVTIYYVAKPGYYFAKAQYGQYKTYYGDKFAVATTFLISVDCIPTPVNG